MPIIRMLISRHHCTTKKICIWCALSGTKIIGTLFFTTTITGEVYLNIIEQFIALLEETNRYCWFQQDDPHPYVAKDSKAVLKSFFNDRFISSGLWPLRSLHLSPLDYFLWRYRNDRVYLPAPATLWGLKGEYVMWNEKTTFRSDSKIPGKLP